MNEMTFILKIFAEILWALWVMIIVIGTFFFFWKNIHDFMRGEEPGKVFKHMKNGIWRTILLWLEVLVAADIILTVVGTPSIEHALSLAIIIIVRTLLSFSLHVEIDQKLPWVKK